LTINFHLQQINSKTDDECKVTKEPTPTLKASVQYQTFLTQNTVFWVLHWAASSKSWSWWLQRL